MLTNDTLPDYLLTRADDVRTALFELTHPESLVLVRDATDREIAVLVMGADKQTGFFFWRPRDYAGSDFGSKEQKEALVGTVFHFSATGYGGVRIHFRVPRPQLIRFDDGSAAFMSAIPERLYRVQRRGIFRALTIGAVRAGGRCQVDEKSPILRFTVRDISVEGVGLRFPLRVGELPGKGSILKQVELDFGDWGSLRADIAVRNVYPVSGQPELRRAAESVAVADGALSEAEAQAEAEAEIAANNATSDGLPPESHVGATFLKLSGRDEIWLQQVVWRLEKNRKPN